MVSLHFVQKLVKKLKTGNNRSIHLNASVGGYSRLDWFDWSLIDSSLHLKFLQLMLTKQSFEFNIKIAPAELQKKSAESIIVIKKLIARLDAISYQSHDEFTEYGTKTFGLGYPLLIRNDIVDSSKHNIAPLLIWYFDIEKDNLSPLSWKIKRSEDHPTVFNELLGNLIQNQEKFSLEDIHNIVENEVFDEEKLSKFCEHFLSLLQVDATQIDSEVKIIPCPDKNNLPKLREVAPCIRWSGVWGLYRHTKESIIADLDLLLKNPEILNPSNIKTKDNVLDNTFIPSTAIDPSQEKILLEYYKHDRFIINGPPGTGKSQSITALISQELSQGRTCLVVCEKKTAQEVIYQNLSKLGLGDLCISADDWIRSRNEAVKAVRYCTDNLDTYISDYKNNTFSTDFEQYNMHKERVNKTLLALNTKIWGDESFSDVLTKLSGLENKYKAIQLKDDSTSSFILDRFNLLKGKIGEGFSKFKSYNLDEDIFYFIPNSIFSSNSQAYLSNEFVVEIDSVFNIVQDLKTCYNNGFKISGESFLDISKERFLLKNTLKYIVPKYKRIITSRTAYYNLFINFASKNSFIQEVFNLESIGTFFKYDAVSKHKTVLEIEKFLSVIVENKLLWQQYIPWRMFLEQQSKEDKAIFKLIALSSIDNWEEALQYVFYHYNLKNNRDDVLKGADFNFSLNEIETLESNLKHLLVEKIKSDWSINRVNLIKEKTIKHTKLLYNFRKNNHYISKNSLRKIIQNDTNFFTRFFPVMISNPTVATSVLPLQLGMYDTVIFDESSQLRLEDTFSSMLRGKKVYISGDKHQMPPSNYFESSVFFNENTEIDSDLEVLSDDFLAESDSLLDYAYDTDFKNYYLDFHYRSRHPDLINFSNVCFYGSRLIPLPALKKYNPFEYHDVQGVYGNGINRLEAVRIVQYLESIHQVLEFQNLSIGIATFNMHQRNLILDLIALRCSENLSFATQFGVWMTQGFFVKNLENIQGEERDIIIISTTFGKNEEGNFKQHFGPILQKNGYKLLNVLITRAKEKVIMFSSIPSEFIATYSLEIQEKGLSGKSILYAYLHYAKLKSMEKQAESEQLLKFLSMNSKDNYYEPFKVSLTPFKQMIYKEILSFNSIEIKIQETWGGIIPDFALYKNEKVLAFVECCDTKFYSTEVGYRHLLFRKQLYSQYQIPSLFILPQDWYQSDGERMLYDFIPSFS